MSGTDTQPDDNDGEEFDLAEFIDDKSSLFAVMGVFVAVAAYLSRAQPGPITDFEVSFSAACSPPRSWLQTAPRGFEASTPTAGFRGLHVFQTDLSAGLAKCYDRFKLDHSGGLDPHDDAPEIAIRSEVRTEPTRRQVEETARRMVATKDLRLSVRRSVPPTSRDASGPSSA